jgi:anion-transporting  ArsA/GET3 family ATPase
MAARQRLQPSDLDAMLAAKEMVLVAGSGGVGKTTIAAALAARAALEIGGRVLVLTVDPARRLADALGIGDLGNTAVRIDPEAVAAASGTRQRGGELWAAMLDTKAGWDELIARHAPDAAVRDAVLANPLYENLTGRFVHSHDYLAMEQLHELHASGAFDLIVVDTPPSRNALDLLDAPGRMREFFGSRLLQWLTVPYRSRLFTAVSRPFYQVADRILGSRFLEDIAEFFVLFGAMEPAFVRHATDVESLLSDHRTSFVVVTTLEAAPAHEAMYLLDELERRRFHLGAVIANRTVPRRYTGRAATTSARRIQTGVVDEGLDREVAAVIGATDAEVAGVLESVAEHFSQIGLVAQRESERRSELAALSPVVVDVPTLDRDVSALSDLFELAGHLR